MFKSAESALEWAALMKCTELYKAPFINKMCWKAAGGTYNELLQGLSQDETRKQAENIYSIVINLNELSKCYIQTRYFFNDDLKLLVNNIKQSVTVNSPEILILGYVGKNVTHRQIRDKLRCNNNKVSEYQRLVYDHLDRIHYRSLSEVERKLEDSGLIEKNY